MRYIFLTKSVAVLAIALFLSCCKDASTPVPECYSGTVLAFDCHNGYLIQVDEQYPIGKPLRVYATANDSLLRPNIIAAVNSLDTLGRPGQHIYFSHIDDGQQHSRNWPCDTQFLWNNLPVPHLLLSNISVTPCPAGTSR